MEYNKTQIGIAYMSGEVERIQNKAKYKKQEAKMSCCSFRYFQYLLHLRYKKSQQCVHTEILFCYKGDVRYADSYGVYEGSGVTQNQRSFANPAYEFIFLDVTPAEFDKIYYFCVDQRGKKFDYKGASWQLLIYPPKCIGHSRSGTWWCASFVHGALRSIGLLTDYRLNTLDNDDLVMFASKSRRKLCGVNPGDWDKLGS